jgi:tetratricopeptide (TPR) repeat protein
MKLLFSFNKALTFLFFALFVLSCGQKEVPATPADAKDFARQLQSSIEKRNPDFFNTAIDKKKFLKKAGLGSGKNARSFGAGVEDRLNMGTTMINSLSKKATYQLVKQYEKNNKQHVLFRLYDDGSLNYHDIELIKSGNNVKIDDIFIYTSGEYLSETIKGLFQQMKGIMDKKSNSSEESAVIKSLPKMRQLMNEGKYEEAISIYETLPPNIQQLRAVQIIHVLIASGLDDTEKYSDAIEEYKKLYPDEPNMHLILIDGYVLKEEYDKALFSVNEMDRMINKDPFLDYYRYLVYSLKKDKANSKICIEKLVKNMPDFEDGMLELIGTYLEEKNNNAADDWIKKFRSKSSFDQDRLDALINANED